MQWLWLDVTLANLAPNLNCLCQALIPRPNIRLKKSANSKLAAFPQKQLPPRYGHSEHYAYVLLKTGAEQGNFKDGGFKIIKVGPDIRQCRISPADWTFFQISYRIRPDFSAIYGKVCRIIRQEKADLAQP